MTSIFILHVYSCTDAYVNPFQIFFLFFFTTNQVLHGRDLRNAEDLHIPYSRLDIRRFSIRINGPNVWNSLPTLIRNSDSVHIFKRRLRNYIIENKLG